MCIISDCEFSSHGFGPAADHEYRVLYVGNNLALLKFLQDRLKDCFVVRAPTGYVARVLIAGETNYSLLLFDEVLPDETAQQMESYAHTRRESLTVITVKPADDYGSVSKAVASALGCGLSKIEKMIKKEAV